MPNYLCPVCPPTTNLMLQEFLINSLSHVYMELYVFKDFNFWEFNVTVTMRVIELWIMHAFFSDVLVSCLTTRRQGFY